MSIERYIKRRLKDTAVYWGSPTFGNDGSATFAVPVEINCLWVEKIELVRDERGKEIVSKAKVYVDQDLDDNGMLYHGKLSDLTAAEKADPLTIDSAYEIITFIKTPSLVSSNEYNRQVYI